MSHAITFDPIEEFTGPDDQPALRLSASCTCGWWGVNERPSRPDREAVMQATLQDNHYAWAHAQGLGE